MHVGKAEPRRRCGGPTPRAQRRRRFAAGVHRRDVVDVRGRDDGAGRFSHIRHARVDEFPDERRDAGGAQAAHQMEAVAAAQVQQVAAAQQRADPRAPPVQVDDAHVEAAQTPPRRRHPVREAVVFGEARVRDEADDGAATQAEPSAHERQQPGRRRREQQPSARRCARTAARRLALLHADDAVRRLPHPIPFHRRPCHAVFSVGRRCGRPGRRSPYAGVAFRSAHGSYT